MFILKHKTNNSRIFNNNILNIYIKKEKKSNNKNIINIFEIKNYKKRIYLL